MKKFVKFEYVISIIFIAVILYAIYPSSDQGKKFYDFVLGTSLYEETPEEKAIIEKNVQCYQKIQNKHYPIGQESMNKRFANPLKDTVEKLLERNRIKEVYCIEYVDTCNQPKSEMERVLLVAQCIKSED